jgi:hypothetical protein
MELPPEADPPGRAAVWPPLAGKLLRTELKLRPYGCVERE